MFIAHIEVMSDIVSAQLSVQLCLINSFIAISTVLMCVLSDIITVTIYFPKIKTAIYHQVIKD